MQGTKEIIIVGKKLRFLLMFIVMALLLSGCGQQANQDEILVSNDRLSAPLPKALRALVVNENNLVIGVAVDGGAPKACTNLSVDVVNFTFTCKITLSGGPHTLSLVYSIIDATYGTVEVAKSSSVDVDVVAGKTAAADFSSAIIAYEDKDNDGINNLDELSEGSSPTESSYYVGGTVNGLLGDSTVVIQLNGSNDLTLSRDGSFMVIPAVADNSAYIVTVLTQPDTLSQTCTVTNGAGIVSGAIITDVTVTCIYELSEIGRVTVPGAERIFMHVEGDYAYIARYDANFYVIDISNKKSLSIKGHIGINNSRKNVHDLWYSNGFAYTAHRFGDVNMINVSNPDLPEATGFAATNYTHRGIISVGDYLYVAEHAISGLLGGMRIYDISEGDLNNEVGSFFGEIDARDLVVSSDGLYAYQSTIRDDSRGWGNSSGLYIFDVSDKSNPTPLSEVIPDIYGYDLTLSPDNKYLYMLFINEPLNSNSSDKGVKIYDLTNRALPSELFSITLANADDIALDYGRKLLYVRTSNEESGIYVYDISKPGNPVQRSFYPITDDIVRGDLFYSDDYLYATEGNDLLVFPFDGSTQ